ncbi:MAG: arsenosugar biosynthesis arsenite methyltransferase ArsM [Saprospiraceae bacterium]|nr:arsenosugar biosynthesis arsenite methyltransferase ArsM [Saprospiraceae bacterium]
MGYLDTTKDVYKKAAESPDVGLCCTTSPIWKLPELNMPDIMVQMNYGCGSTINPRDLADNPNILYVGVGGGMEVLQFSYFSRKKRGVIGIDIVDEMLDACSKNLKEAENLNPWFSTEFVDLRKGTALSLPIESESIDVAAQNCLFNIFEKEDLKKALSEIYRVLKPQGRLVLSDPICEQIIPQNLQDNEKLRALCLSGCLPLQEYLNMITEIGFGTVEVRARRPYRILSSNHYDTEETLFIESVEIAAIKDPMPEDGPCIFTGRSAIYYGKEDYFDDHNGHVLVPNVPLAVCDKTGNALLGARNPEIYVSESTYFYDGGGCC